MHLIMHFSLESQVSFYQAGEVHTERRSRRECTTIQTTLAGGKDARQVQRKLIVLRAEEQNSLRRRVESAKSEGDLPKHADAADLARIITAVFQGMTLEAINDASREDLRRLAEMAVRARPT